MKNLTKKIGVLLVAILMVTTLCTTRTVSADIDRTKDHAELKISGFDGEEKVTMYKLYKANYEETDTDTKDKKINSYTFTNPNLVDGKDEIELAPARKYTQEDYDAYVQKKGSNPIWNVGDDKPAVVVKIENLAVGSDGKIVATQEVDWETFNLSNITSKVYPNLSNNNLKISDLVGKYPFSTDKPKETQINAISAAIASNSLNIDKVTFTLQDGSTQDYLDVPANAEELDIEVYAKSTAAPTDQRKPAIYDATGIFLVRVEPAAGTDTVYNPAIVSVGYATSAQGGIEYTTSNYDLENTEGYRYDTTSTTLKKTNPTVDKTVSGGMIENDVDEPVVALDLDGNPLNYVLGQPDILTYILKGKTQQNVNDELKKTSPNLESCTTKDVEQALTKKELIHSGSEGTKFTYTVTPTLPSYPVNAVNKTLWFSDTLSNGLDYVESSLEVVLKNSEITKTYNSETKKYEFFVNNPNGKYGYYLNNNVMTQADDTNPATHSLLATAVDNTNGFNITFDYDAIPGGNTAELKLNYDAVIETKEAIVGLKGMPNVVTMVYANKPDEGSTHDVKNTDKPQDKGNKKIEDYEIVYTYEVYLKKVDDQGKPLKDAIFGLFAAEKIYYQDGENNANGTLLYDEDDLVCTIKTNADGIGYTTEIGPGKYYVKELEAPDGYQLNSTQYPVEVNWTKATKKVLVTHETWEYTTEQPTKKTQYHDYSVQVGWLIGTSTDGKFYQLDDYPISEWTFTEVDSTTKEGKLTKGDQTIEKVWKAYIDPEKHVISETFEEIELTNESNTNNNGWVLVDGPIPNTKTPELPSTGGIGTYLFTIAGVAIIATAMFMLIFRKREEHNH